ncbi:hypothetical protein [Nocardiopsis baichengensis]|nr:hypothetical protein [Nocardiopsis baichengensis]
MEVNERGTTMDWPTAAIIIVIVLAVAFVIAAIGTTYLVRGSKDDT